VEITISIIFPLTGSGILCPKDTTDLGSGIRPERQKKNKQANNKTIEKKNLRTN